MVTCRKSVKGERLLNEPAQSVIRYLLTNSFFRKAAGKYNFDIRLQRTQLPECLQAPFARHGGIKYDQVYIFSLFAEFPDSVFSIHCGNNGETDFLQHDFADFANHRLIIGQQDMSE